MDKSIFVFRGDIVSHTKICTQVHLFCLVFSVATALIKKYREAYTLAQNNEKKAITRGIVATIMEKGRFLKKNKNGDWTTVQSEAARVKVAQALQYRRRRSISMSQEAADSNKQEGAQGFVHDAEEKSSEHQAPEAWQVPSTVQLGTEEEWQLEMEDITVSPSSTILRDQYQLEDEWLQATTTEEKVEASVRTNDLLTDVHESRIGNQQATRCITTCRPFSNLRCDRDSQEDRWFQSASGEQLVASSACTLPFESATDVHFAAPAALRQLVPWWN